MKIVIISSNFFGYSKKIQEKLESQGHEVNLVNDFPNDSKIVKIICRLSRGKLNFLFNDYFRKELLKFGDVDRVLVIKGETLSVSSCDLINQISNNRAVLYQWDSLANNRNLKNIMNSFSNLYSFDFEDCEKYDFKYLPLFHDIDCGFFQETINVKDYDVSFVGTVHEDRLPIINKIEDKLKLEGYKTNFYRYYPSKWLLKIRKIIDYRLWRVDISNVNYQPLSYSEYLSFLLRGKATVDIHRRVQSGLTIRTVEALAMDIKIITTNDKIKDECGDLNGQVLIIDRSGDLNNSSVVKLLDAELNENCIRNKYHLDYWVNEILSGT
ncbi:hypothetical protein AB4490_14640 [Vibrio cyclitrophicus]